MDQQQLRTRALEGKTALVTGASRGIGRAIAERLARDGANIVVNYARHAAQAQEVVAAITAQGGRAVAVQADIGNIAEVEYLFTQTLAAFGPLHILVNNAGMQLLKPLAEVNEDEFDRMVAVNLKGLFFACQHAGQVMVEGGRIINLSTTVTRVMLPTYSIYAATKGAVEQLTRQLAPEFGARQITINTLAPGPTETDMLLSGKTPEQVAAQTQFIAQMTALGRLGQPRDIADIVAFLASDDARWINGQTIYANGGFA